MKQHILAMAAAVIATTATAQTPEQVLEPYRAYMKAMEAGDRDSALERAREAYNAAELIMPSVPQTGALAENLADIETSVSKRLDLYRRALDILPADAEPERRVDLMSKLARTHIYQAGPLTKKDVRLAEKRIDELQDYAARSGFSGTTYEAEAHVLKAWVHNYFGREGKALDSLDAATAIFDSPRHQLFSVLEYQSYLIKGEVLKRQDKPIEGAVALQKVMQNLEGELPVDHPFISRAFSSWLGARSQIQVAGLEDRALAEGVCKCWPYDEISENRPVPLQRIPPRPPRNAKRSGYVDLKFDIDREGNPINIRAVSGTDRSFIRPSVKAVESWRYEVQPSHKDEDLSGIATRLTYRIMSNSGKFLPEGELQVWESPPTEG